MPEANECLLEATHANGAGRWLRGQRHGHASKLDEPRLRRILQLQLGNPCPCSNNTKPSWRQTNRPSNWRIQHRNRMARTTSRTLRPDLGTPCHGLCSTTPFWPQTTRPASLRIHPGSCKDLLGVGLPWAGRRCDDGYSTMSACLGPTRSTLPPHNCMDQQVPVELWAVSEAGSWAESQGE